MNRFVSVAFVAGLASLSSAQLSFDDEKVVAVSMETLFSDASWISEDWKRGDVVLIEPEWASKKRTPFGKTLAEVIAEGGLKEPSLDASDLQRSLKRKPSWKPPVPFPLRSMRLNSRILVGEFAKETPQEPDFGWEPGRFHVKNRDPNLTIRVPFTLQAPGYSPDGQFALLKGWSIAYTHPAHVAFLLRRKAKDWIVVQVFSRVLY